MLDTRIIGSTLYCTVGSGIFQEGVEFFEPTLLAYDISDPKQPNRIDSVPEILFRTMRAAGDRFYTWEDNQLVARNQNFGIIDVVDLPPIVVDEIDTIRAGGF